jgi:hypothetical protein
VSISALLGPRHFELRDLQSARSQLASAQDKKANADQAVAATQKRIDDLTAQSDGVVIDAFMNPPADTALDAMGAASAGDASVKASIVAMQHDADASILARLRGAHEELDAHKAAQDDAGRRAAAAADTAAAALDDLEAAQFGWLASHAAGYGLHNLPSEPGTRHRRLVVPGLPATAAWLH